MAKTFKVVLMTVLVLYAGLCTAEEKKSDSRSIQTLMIKSGLSKQLEQIAPMVQAAVTQQNQGSQALSPEEVKELSGMAARAFGAKALKEKVQKHIQANLSETDIQAALAWLSTPLGEKITKLEEDASTPAAYGEMQKMADKLTGNAGRVDLARKLDNAVKATETGVAVALNTQTALIAALTSGAPPEKRPTIENIEKEVMKNKGQIQSTVEQATLLSFLYAYRSLSDAEIGKYIDFAGSASGKKYHAVTAEGVTAAVTNAARVLGNLIAQKASKKAPGASRKQDI
jgi:hypothetical protein